MADDGLRFDVNGCTEMQASHNRRPDDGFKDLHVRGAKLMSGESVVEMPTTYPRLLGDGS